MLVHIHFVHAVRNDKAVCFMSCAFEDSPNEVCWIMNTVAMFIQFIIENSISDSIRQPAVYQVDMCGEILRLTMEACSHRLVHLVCNLHCCLSNSEWKLYMHYIRSSYRLGKNLFVNFCK